MISAGLLNTTASVWRTLARQNDIGAIEKTFRQIIISLPCRIRQLKATEIVPVADVDGVVLTHRLYCNPDTAIQVGDEVRVGSTVYRVGAVNDVDLAGAHWQIDLFESRPDRHGR